jgi:serine/threonine protein phosphatase PrpC
VICQRWLRPSCAGRLEGRLDFGVASRCYRYATENGDAFVIKRWQQFALAGVIDGLGHGQFARRASQAARSYVERHFDQPFESLFRGVGRACRATRGVVMSLARLDLAQQKLTVAGVGNVELRLAGDGPTFRYVPRRGILGLNAPNPVLEERPWTSSSVLILHSDGLRTHWSVEEFLMLLQGQANRAAQQLLAALGKPEDDSTVVVVKNGGQ